MYAVIKTGGKQYRVEAGTLLKVETLSAELGSTFEFTEVLMCSDGKTVTCGTPFVKNAVVKAEIVEHARHKKVRIIKFRRRKHHMKQMGHRQNYTQVKILSIHQ